MTDTFNARLQALLAPYVTAETDPSGAHQIYLTALAQAFEAVFGLAMDQGNDPDSSSYVFGWAALLDVDLCPAQYLPYLAQFNGTVIPDGTSASQARQIIRAESGQQRGRPSAIISAVQRNLSGTQAVTLFERTGSDGTTPNPWWFVIVVLTSQVINATKLVNDVNSVKPGGIQWTLVQASSWTIAQVESTYATINAVEAAFSTVNHVEADVLG